MTTWGPPPGQPGQPGYGPTSGWQPHQGPAQTEPKAIVALVLAVAAWTPIVPFVGAIAALVLARMARNDILRSGGTRSGLGLCAWATGLSIAHLIFVALLVVGALLLVLLPLTLFGL